MITRGRQRIEIKLIENKAARNVSFSKRRAGLFKKVRELSILCGVKIGALVFSPAGKPFTFDAPTLESLLLQDHLQVPSDLPALQDVKEEEEEAPSYSSPAEDRDSFLAMVMEGKPRPYCWEEFDVQAMGREELYHFLEVMLAYRGMRLEEMAKLGTGVSDPFELPMEEALEDSRIDEWLGSQKGVDLVLGGLGSCDAMANPMSHSEPMAGLTFDESWMGDGSLTESIAAQGLYRSEYESTTVEAFDESWIQDFFGTQCSSDPEMLDRSQYKGEKAQLFDEFSLDGSSGICYSYPDLNTITFDDSSMEWGI